MSLELTSRAEFAGAKRWVVKVGSALLTDAGRGLDRQLIAAMVAQLAALRQEGREVVLVSSGAVAAGMVRLGWSQRPHALHELQAAAAVGQMSLVQTYESAFQQYSMHTAQVLLGHDDISARDRYLNARSTLTTLLELGVVPVVNENDTVVTDEIRFGDNDTLAALVANLIDADVLLILTDQQGLFDADPRSNPDAKLISEAYADEQELEAVAGGGGVLGRGGMLTKVRAARLAARSGTDTVIVHGGVAGVISQIASGSEQGTWLRAGKAPLAARKQWLAGLMRGSGSLVLDAGAVRVLCESGKSLLAVGVVAVEGSFARGDVVLCVDPQGNEVARGLVNYGSEEARRIMGHGSEQIESLLGYQGEPELVHRDNLVLSGPGQ
ncbi:glutamate 5-kinase [Halieaceae bacterium IMCC14734]|uniref:Glutamate 5-kinase n=1 Tax=Candidatus Litorirhabdus singularis TaxID=2518993 RepID=A0ABT3TC25_9GAMM|nr:glutamate 5-kinase [Candidatus Litorirhabdus singularis]MCX2979385.1 glutamate 5-kinase [Candidatus Litorirhabdus singularis]